MFYEVCSWPQFACRNVAPGIRVGGTLFLRDAGRVGARTTYMHTINYILMVVKMPENPWYAVQLRQRPRNSHGPTVQTVKRLGATHPRA